MIDGLNIVDNFFDNPDFVREHALSLRSYSPCNYFQRAGIYSGYRTPISNQNLESFIMKKIEGLYNKKLKYCSMTFHLNTETSMFGCPHKDSESRSSQGGADIAGVVYLSKNSPSGCGTVLYEEPPQQVNQLIESYYDKMQIVYDVKLPSYNRIKRQIADELLAMKNTLKVNAQSEHVYNTLIIYSAHTLHSPGFYFGDTLANGRLTIPIHAKFE